MSQYFLVFYAPPPPLPPLSHKFWCFTHTLKQSITKVFTPLPTFVTSFMNAPQVLPAKLTNPLSISFNNKNVKCWSE